MRKDFQGFQEMPKELVEGQVGRKDDIKVRELGQQRGRRVETPRAGKKSLKEELERRAGKESRNGEWKGELKRRAGKESWKGEPE